jgi:hypothetical protein
MSHSLVESWKAGFRNGLGKLQQFEQTPKLSSAGVQHQSLPCQSGEEKTSFNSSLMPLYTLEKAMGVWI